MIAWIAALVLAVESVGAQVLDTAVYSLAPGGATGTAPGTFQFNASNSAGTITNVASSSGQDASASASSTGAVSGGSVAQVTYYFAVVGPAFGPVKIDVEASGDASASGSSATGESTVGIDNLVSYYACATVGGNCGGESGSFFVSTVLTVATCVVSIEPTCGGGNPVYLSAQTETGSGGGFATALADPYFEIDPNQPNASAYSLVFSPGISNVAPPVVPEPSTWALMLLGLVSLGFASYRRHVERLRPLGPAFQIDAGATQ